MKPAEAGAMSGYRHRLLLIVLAWLLSVAASGAPSDEQVDHVELAAVLVQDGHHDRAAQVLAQISDPEAEGIDVGRFHLVYGLVHLHRKAYGEAVRSFEAAMAAGLVDTDTGQAPDLLRIYLAQAHFGLEQYSAVLEQLEHAGETARRLSSVWTLRAHAHWMLGERQQAFDVLALAMDRFEHNHGFLRRQVFYLIELGLYQQAAELGRAYLQQATGSLEDRVAIGNALRQAGQHTIALQFLEAARLEFPHSTDLAKVLARTWMEAGNPISAAAILRDAAVQEPALLAEAAELYRRAGRLYEALLLNGQIVDQEKKLRQRLAILLALQRYQQLTAMEDALHRQGLLDDESLRYALAYAWFKVGGFQRAESHLAAITTPELFRKAVELRRAMEECRTQPWRCS